MGEVADTLTTTTTTTTTTKRKKKGRPSLIDLQKRALKQQQLLLDEPHEKLRSGFKNPTSPNSDGGSNRRNFNRDDGDDRRDKKLRPLHGLDYCNFKSEGEKASKATDILQRSLVECGNSTPLPDKKLLIFILDRLQKKDTYGVYSDPVDPQELPDYHEIIKNPMDFSTLRKKLESGAYANLEQFEQDVFLICTNAMEYNSADSVYFRQARAILEMAKKDFENLRQESDGEEQPKVVKRGRPPGTGLKKHTEPSSIDRTTSVISANATAQVPGCGDGSRLSGAYNLRKAPPSYRFRQAETSVRISHNSENQSGLLIDWESEFPRSVVKAVNKYGMKNVDENRRDTYNQISTSLQEATIFTMLEDDIKQLTPVGLRTEYGYARSLARYAANIGPVAWRFADRRIKTLLPTGIKLGENQEAPSLQQQSLMSGKQKCPNDLASEDHHHPSRILSPTTSVSSSIIGNKESETNQLESSVNPENNCLVHDVSRFNHNPNQRLETASSQQSFFAPKSKRECDGFPQDLNAGMDSPKSPGSNHQADASLPRPDLALQL